MSILANKDTRVVIQGGVAGLNAARRMAEFCYMVKRPLNVEAFVYPPDASKANEVPYGNGLVTIPVYKTVADATAHHPTINTSLVYVGADRATAAGMEALAALDDDARLAGQRYRLDAARGNLHDMAGERDAARRHFRVAAKGTASLAERNYLLLKAAELNPQ